MKQSSEERKTLLQAGFRIGDWHVEPRGNRLQRNGESYQVGSKAMDLLVLLASRPGETVSKDEIFSSVWSDTFVTDNALWKCISELRQILEEDPGKPKRIVTVARRGYRLEPVVSQKPTTQAARGAAVGGIALAVLAIGGLLGWPFLGSDKTESFASDGRPHILVARLDNRSGEKQLDGTLEVLLETWLNDSGQLHLVSRPRVEKALELMGLPADSEISEELAREVSLRDGGIDLLVTGQIDRLGEVYRLAIKLLDGKSHDLIASASRETEKVEALLPAGEELSWWLLDKLMTDDSVKRAPPEQATTNSVAALTLYTRGLDLYYSAQDSSKSPKQRSVEMGVAEALFKDAIWEDPEFAPAHLMLAVTRFEVRYAIDPVNPFNFVPDGKGLFQSSGCQTLDCPYVDGENGFIITEDGFGAFQQVQQFDRDLRDLFGGTFHYRYFETDVESQAINGDLCPSLIVPATGWTLGGSYDGEAVQKVRLSLWFDAWPDAEQESIWTTGSALLVGLAPVEDDAGPVSKDFDRDGRLEPLLDSVSPTWRLVWNEQEAPGSQDLLVTREGRRFRVESLGAAMLTAHRRADEESDCGLVDARFELVATPMLPVPLSEKPGFLRRRSNETP